MSSTKIKSVLIIIGIILVSLPLNLLSSNSNNLIENKEQNFVQDDVNDLKTSVRYGFEQPIYIDDADPTNNWNQFVAEYGDEAWFGGSGTYDDPYILRNLETWLLVDQTNNFLGYPCITIKNSEAYFNISRCSLRYSDVAGIYLENVRNGEISENEITDNEDGVYLHDCYENVILNNTISVNRGYGIVIDGCTNNYVLENVVNQNGDSGIYLDDSHSVKISDNIINQNENHGVFARSYVYAMIMYNNEISGNTINYNVVDGIHLLYSANSIIKENNVSYNGIGIYILDSFENAISSNTLNSNRIGIYLLSYSTNNNVSFNTICNSTTGILFSRCNQNVCFNNLVIESSRGISLRDCSNIIISENSITDCTQGISSTSIADNNQIINNIISQNGYGITFVLGGDENLISGNTFESNRYGISLKGGNNNRVIYNSFDGNPYLRTNAVGILIDDGSSNTEISENVFKNHGQYGIKLLEGSENLVYKNYFYNNRIQAYDSGINNRWDSDSMGNCWDDYVGIDLNPRDGIGDDPYDVPGISGSTDNFPIIFLRPDFVVNDVVFATGVGEISIYASISNLGFDYDGDVTVRFLERNVDGSTEIIETDKVVDGLLGNEEITVSVKWIPKLYRDVLVVIDPEDVIDEFYEYNNLLEKGYAGHSPVIKLITSKYGLWKEVNLLENILAGIDLVNTFTAEVVDLDGDDEDDDIYKVEFKLNEQAIPTKGYPGTGNLWHFDLNMKDLHGGNNTLEINAYDEGGHKTTKILTIKAKALPLWLNEILFMVGTDLVEIRVELLTQTLTIIFKYPFKNPAIKPKTTPEDVPFVGGKDNNYSYNVKGIFKISFLTWNPSFELRGEVRFSVLNYGMFIRISGKGEFDLQLNIQSAELKFYIEFTLPIFDPGTINSKKCPVSLECSVVAKASISIRTVLRGIGLVLEWVEFELITRVSIIGWLRIGVDLGWASANLDIEIGGSVSIPLGVDQDGFFISLNVRIYLRWSIVWKLLFLRGIIAGGIDWTYKVASPEEYNETSAFEDWAFTDNNTLPADSRPRVATDRNGNAMMVWTETRYENNEMYTDICYSKWNGTDWEKGSFVTFDEQPDSDPSLTYDSEGNVMLVWSRVTGNIEEMTAENPFDIFRTQEIAYSIWDGTSWSDPSYVTNDNYADGCAVVSASPTGEIITAWVGDPDYNFTTSTDMEIFYSIWDGNSWSQKTALTNDDNMDYDITIAHNSEGKAVISWIRDLDGDKSTTNDTELRYALWDGSWHSEDLVVDSNDQKESPSLTFDHNDNALITWVGRNENGSRIYFATLDEQTGFWGEPEVVHEDPFFIYNPAINVDPDNSAVIVWRGFEDDEQERSYYLENNATDTYFDGEICYAIKDLNRPEANWSEQKYLTSDNKTDWMASAVIIRGHSNDLLLVWNRDGELSNLMHEIKPDLFIDNNSISFSDADPNEGDVIDVLATIYNIGDVKADNVNVSLYDGDPSNGGIYVDSKIIDLDYDASETIQFSWTVRAWTQRFYVKVDPDSSISELSEDNNVATNALTILPDLSVLEEYISFSNSDPLEGEVITIEALVFNYGGTAAENVIVEFKAGDNVIGYDFIPIIEVDSFAYSSISWVVSAGENNVSVCVDPNGEILEKNVSNNKAFKLLNVYTDLEAFDLTISSDSIIYGESITINANVRNVGKTNAVALVEFFDGDPFEDGVLIHSLNIDLSIGESKVIEFNWFPSIGDHRVFIVIDRANDVKETNEFNNVDYQEFVVFAFPDLQFSALNVNYSPDSIIISATIENSGQVGATGIVIDVYDGDPSLGGYKYSSHLILGLGVGELTTIEIEIPSAPSNDFIIVIDEQNLIEEINEENNHFVIDHLTIPAVDCGLDQIAVEGDIVQFTGLISIGNIEDYELSWDFGDNTIGEGANPQHQYGDKGIYVATFQVVGEHYIGTDQLVVSVSNVIPTVDAGSDFMLNIGEEAILHGNYFDPGYLDTHTIKWDFGDNTIISGTLNPTHAYIAEGVYTVTLTVTDDDGGVGIDTLTVTVIQPVPIVNTGPDQVVNEGQMVSFSGSFTDSGITHSHIVGWDFGDGSYASGTLTPTHTYADDGDYTVILTVTNNYDRVGTNTLIVTVNNVAPTADAGPDAISNEGEPISFAGGFIDLGDDTHEYQWDFGDGTIISGTLTPTHIYGDNDVYIVALTVTDDDGGVGTDTLIVTVSNVAPVADAGQDDTSNEGAPISFPGGFIDPGDDAHEYLWDFGDGTSISGTLTPTHTYGDNGVYIVNLTVTDDDGGVGSDTTTITVNNVAPTILPVNDRVVEEDKTYFYSWSFTDPGMWDTHSAIIDWGDGTTPESGIVSEDQGDGTVSASHSYTMPSHSYTITLTLEDKDGGIVTAAFSVEVLDKTPPDTTFELDGTMGNNGWYVSDVTVTLTATDGYSDIYSICYSHASVNMEIYDVDSTWFVASDEGEITIYYYSIDTEGNIESTKTLTLYIDKTAPTTTLVIQGPQSILDATTYVSTATTFMLEATDADLPFGSGIDIIEYRIDSDDNDDWIEYSGSFSISEIGVHTIDYRSIDVAGNEDEIKPIEIVVNDSELTYLGEFEGAYSDPVVLKANLTDIATGLPIPYKTIVFTIGTQTFTAETDITGVATYILILDQPGGDYTVYASFADDGEFLASNDESTFKINNEYAYAEYTGDMVVPLNAETITLRATIYDEDDGNWGDLTKIYVTITIWDSTNIIPIYTSEPLEVELTIVDGVGVATISIPNNYLEDSYLVQINIDPGENDYYLGDSLNFFTLIIYEPVGDFVTGGGWIVDANGNKGNFGFNVKYKKHGLPKGQAIYVYREGDYIFIIKANAWVGMAIISEENYTIFEAKCNIKQVNAITGEIIWEEGNYKLIIEAWDHSKDGKGDIIQIHVYDKIGILFYEIGFDPYGYLIGGNIVIHIDEKK